MTRQGSVGSRYREQGARSREGGGNTPYKCAWGDEQQAERQIYSCRAKDLPIKRSERLGREEKGRGERGEEKERRKRVETIHVASKQCKIFNDENEKGCRS
jgi:hypothetical protein